MYSGDPCLHRQRCSRILLLLLVAALPKLCLFFFSRWREFSLCSTPRRLCLYQGKMSNFWGNVVFIFRASLLLVLSFSEEAVSHVKANECKVENPPQWCDRNCVSPEYIAQYSSCCFDRQTSGRRILCFLGSSGRGVTLGEDRITCLHLAFLQHRLVRGRFLLNASYTHSVNKQCRVSSLVEAYFLLTTRVAEDTHTGPFSTP